MKKLLLVMVLLVFWATGIALSVSAQRKDVEIYFFKSDSCPYCKKMGEIITVAKDNNPELKVHEYEIVSSEIGRKLLAELARVYQVEITGVPVVFIGEEAIRGLDEERFNNALRICQEKGCASPVDKINPEVLKSILSADEENSQSDVKTNHNYIGWIIGGGIAALVIFALIFAGLRKDSPENPSIQS